MGQDENYVTLASYLPRIVLERLAAKSTANRGAIEDHRSGAVLIADVSGFTTITESLAARGAIGAEQLTNLLNAYFGRVIDSIAAHGGDIVRFAGDAILAIWTADDCGDLREAAYRATRCALTLQRELRGYRTEAGMELAIKIGVGTGDFTCMHLGGEFDRWEILITGVAFLQSFAALDQAKSGQVVVSLQSWSYLQDRIQGTQLQMGSVLVEAGADEDAMQPISERLFTHLPEEHMQSYVPGTVVARLNAGHKGWLGELRVVSVIFVNLPDLNYATTLDRAQSTIQYLQQELYRFEGSINKLNLDDKGTSLLAALGLPPLAHEDDPRRAVNAAMAIQQRLLESGMQSSIGIATGRVFCGAVGSKIRHEYTMMGDVVNLAARLMQTSLGDIHCDETTRQMSHARIEFQRLADINIKGKATKVPVYRPVAIQGSSRQSLRSFVGRQHERALLQDRLASIRQAFESSDSTSSNGAVVMIEGPPGIGKSELVSDFLDHARGSNTSCYIGSGDSIESSTLYHAWQPVIYQLLGIGLVAGTVAERSAMVLKQLSERYPDLVAMAPLLGNALSIDLPDNVNTQHISGKARGEQTREIVRQLIQREVQREPVVLVLEDIHWLDSTSWKLLTELVRSAQPMLIVLTSRIPESTDENYRVIHSLPQTTHLVLDRLSRSDIEQLLQSELDIQQIPEVLAETIYRKADGNPLFTEQLIMVIRDRLKEASANGSPPTRFDDLDTKALEFPDTLHGLITGRIDRLPPSPQLTIKVASVIGRRFSYDALHDNYPVVTDQIQLRESISVGLQSGLIEADISGLPAAYQFQHAIAHEAAYSLLLFHQRQQLHRSIAEWYESTGQQEIASNQSLLAYHWHHAGDEARAVSYFERSGDAALRNGAYAEAVNFFREAIQADAKGTDRATNLCRATWHRKLAESHLGLGQLVDCQAALESALQLLGRVLPPTSPRLIASVSRQAVVQLWRRLSHRKRRCSQTSDANAAASLEAARCYERLAEIYYLSNDRSRLVHAILSSLNLAECDGPTSELARAYANSCFAAGLAGLHPLARAYAENAHEVAAIAGDPTATAWVLKATGIYCLAMGKCDEAQSRFEPAIELCKQIGDWQHWGETMASSAQAAYFSGDFQRGFETWSDLYDRAKSRGDDLQKAWGLNGRAEGFLRLGGDEHAEFAAASLDESLKLLTQNVDRVSRFGAYGLMALTQQRRGDMIAARQMANDGMRLAIELAAPTGYYSLNGYYGVARTYLALWKQAPPTDTELPKLALRACQALRRYARVFPVGWPSFMQCHGLALWLSGEQKSAISSWRKGLIAAQRMRLRYAEGLLHYELARHLPVIHVDRQHHIDAAREHFKLLDADFDLEATCLLTSPTA